MAPAPLERQENFPSPLPIIKLIGPSFIILGVGLGSGELILWPYLASNFGLGLVWAAVLGITFQFLINMEIERYTLATGESVFVGFTRKFGRFAPIWFMFSTIVPWVWPGILAASALVLCKALGVNYSGTAGILLLLLLGGIFSLGRVVYKTQETVQKAIILLGVPFVLALTLYIADSNAWAKLGQGLLGNGEGFKFLPTNLPFATFLAALAYAGAGGNLNLAQSLYVKEKGYGMAKYSGKITNLFLGKADDVKLEGHSFDITAKNAHNFKIWWRRINLEHGLVFLLTGAFTMLLLSLLAYSTVFGNPNAVSSINFVLLEAEALGVKTVPFIGTFFLLMVSLMLFGTQFSVYGSNSRIAAENLSLMAPRKFPVRNISKHFYIFLWLQISIGIGIFAAGFTEPLNLVIIGAVLNALSMFIYSGLILWLNKTSLPYIARPSLLRTILVLLAFLFYGGFSLFTIYDKFF